MKGKATGPVPKQIPLTLVRQPTPTIPPEFEQLQAWIGTALERLENLKDESAREEVFSLLEGVDLLHRQALGRLLDLVARLGSPPLVERLAEDPVVRALLEMYDLPEPDERTQVERALQTVYAYIESHGAKLDVLGVEQGRVRVRLSGSCGSCPASAGTLKRVVEDALREGFPAFRELVSEEPAPTPKQPLKVGRLPLRRPRWVSAGSEQDLAHGEISASWPEGQSVLLARLGSEVYAYKDGCPPGSPLTLQKGRLEGETLVCPWHGCRYDLRTGKRQDAAGKLQVLPVAVRDGEIIVAVGTEEVESQ